MEDKKSELANAADENPFALFIAEAELERTKAAAPAAPARQSAERASLIPARTRAAISAWSRAAISACSGAARSAWRGAARSAWRGAALSARTGATVSAWSRAAVSPPSRGTTYPWSRAAYDARWLLTAFALGLIGGASLTLSTRAGSPNLPISSASSPQRTSASAVLSSTVSLPSEDADTASRPVPESTPPVVSTNGSTSRPSPAAPRPASGRGRAAAAAASVQRPVRFRGSLAVNSKPSGARIILDGTPRGVTPLVLPRVPAGSHVLRLEMNGYRVSASAVQVVANRSTRVTVALDPVRSASAR